MLFLFFVLLGVVAFVLSWLTIRVMRITADVRALKSASNINAAAFAARYEGGL